METSMRKILIADDDLDDAALLAEAIGTILPDAYIDFARDGIAALRHLKTATQPDIVFLDLNMPLKNGLQCLRDIHNHELLQGKPVIIYSTSNNLRDIDEAYNYDAAYYLIKPSSYRQLCKMVQYIVSTVLQAPANKTAKADFVLTEAKLAANPLGIPPL
ncbi:response regulator [Aridibaculum aurantiacum]|uniref:response regulator n=1 Tax=Aridibaculum aurantiacum TaxID=2810307 RepID=UPI001A97D1EE|nr:response regulator [Aridibaculum aurantiacum]